MEEVWKETDRVSHKRLSRDSCRDILESEPALPMEVKRSGDWWDSLNKYSHQIKISKMFFKEIW